MSLREDAGCIDDGVDVSVGVGVEARVDVGVSGLAVSLGVDIGVSLVVASPLPTSLDSYGACPRSGSLTTQNIICSLAFVASDEILPLEPDDRHPTTSQKIPTSKQQTSHEAPTSVA